VAASIASQLQFRGSPELMRWKSKNGKTYKLITDCGNKKAAYQRATNTIQPGDLIRHNTSTNCGCRADSVEVIPGVGVFGANGAAGAVRGGEIGVQCAGPRQFPADSNDPNTGEAGLVVSWTDTTAD